MFNPRNGSNASFAGQTVARRGVKIAQLGLIGHNYGTIKHDWIYWARLNFRL